MQGIGELRRGILRVQEQLWYGTLFAALAVLSGLLLFVELVFSLPRETIATIHTADLFIAYVFLADFFVGIAITYNRRKYIKENWLNLASSIPISNEAFRALRLLRFIRAARVTRAALNVKQAFDRRSHLQHNHKHAR